MKHILKTSGILSSHGHHFPFSSNKLLKTMDLLSLHQFFLLYELKLFSSASKKWAYYHDWYRDHSCQGQIWGTLPQKSKKIPSKLVIWMNAFQIQHDRNHRDFKNNKYLLGLGDYAFSGILRKVIYTLWSFSKNRTQFLLLLQVENYLPAYALRCEITEYQRQNYQYFVGFCCILHLHLMQ